MANRTARKVPDYRWEVRPLEFPLTDLPQADALAVAGGDGSVSTIAGLMVRNQDPRPLLVLPNGSQNGFHRALVDARTAVSLDKLDNLDPKKVPIYYPGVANDMVFNHGFSWNQDNVLLAQKGEEIRKYPMPRVWKLRLVTLMLILSKLRQHPEPETLFELMMASSFMGAARFISDQDLYSNELSRVKIKGGKRVEVLGRLPRTLVHVVQGKALPGEYVEHEKREKFILEGERVEYLNVDGQVVPISPTSEFEVSRSKVGYRPIAIVPRNLKLQ